MVFASLSGGIGRKEPFIIEFLPKHNIDWHGEITWLDRKETVRFSTIMEMLEILGVGSDFHKEPFVIDLLSQSNGDWCGEITWVRGRKSILFSGIMEMLELLGERSSNNKGNGITAEECLYDA